VKYRNVYRDAISGKEYYGTLLFDNRDQAIYIGVDMPNYVTTVEYPEN
jgi:hypothetical protein